MKKLFASLILLSVINTSQAQPATQATYTDQGVGQPLVLIHAFPADQNLWKPQIKSLSKKFRVITLDLKGFGAAQQTQGEAVSMHEYAKQVKELLDKLKIEKAIIGGESMGGYVSLAFAKDYPDMVSGLILADTQAIADTSDQKTKREKTALDVLSNGSGKLIENFVPKAVTPMADQSTKDFLTTLFNHQSANAIASALRGMAMRENNMELLPSLKMPVLIISGDLDEVISPSESVAMDNAIPQSQLVIIHNAGHLANVEKPEEWNRAVVNAFYRSNIL